MAAQNATYPFSLLSQSFSLVVVGEKPGYIPYMNLDDGDGEMIGSISGRTLESLTRCLMRRLKIKESAKRSTNSRYATALEVINDICKTEMVTHSASIIRIINERLHAEERHDA